MKPYIIYDIETFKSDRAEEFWDQKKITPDARLTDPKKIEADIAKKKATNLSKSALSPITGRITCMGLSFNGDFKFWISKNEKDLLIDIDTYIDGKDVSTFVAHNADFDLKMLRLRHLANKIPMPEWLRPGTRHTDTMKMISWQDKTALADIEFLLDIRRDSPKDGKAALTMWEEGDWEGLEKYNESDVRTTETLFLMLEGVSL